MGDRAGAGKGEGYAHGIDPGFNLYRRCLNLGIRVSIYGFAHENTWRPAEQREAFRSACASKRCVAWVPMPTSWSWGTVGHHCFPQRCFQRFTERTRLGRGGVEVNLLINYSWRWDLRQLSETGGSAPATSARSAGHPLGRAEPAERPFRPNAPMPTSMSARSMAGRFGRSPRPCPGMVSGPRFDLRRVSLAVILSLHSYEIIGYLLVALWSLPIEEKHLSNGLRVFLLE